MKLSACTILYLDYATLDETLRRFAKFGYRGVDVWAYSPHVDPMIDRGDRGDIKKLAGDLGLDLVALAVNGGPLARHLNFSHSLQWIRQDTVDYYKKCVDLAEELGCSYINMISGAMMHGTTKQQAWLWHVEGMGQICEHAHNTGVTVALHTAPPAVSRVLTFLDDALQLMNDINSPACKIMIDTASQFITETAMCDSIRKVSEHLVYLHLCDTTPEGFPGHEPIGTGIIQWPLFIQTLKEVGYNGYLTVQLDANAKPIDPDAWMYDSFHYMKNVMQECGVWED